MKESERSKIKLKARFPRLNFLRKKQAQIKEPEWVAYGGSDGMVKIVPVCRRTK